MRVPAWLSALLLWPFVSSQAAIAESVAGTRPDYGWVQTWTGTDVHNNGWLTYAGTTASPFTDIYSDGLRLRATTGYGGYGWQGKKRLDANDPNSPYPTGDATTDYADFLIGYYQQLGPVTLKAFAGVAMIEHHLGNVPAQVAIEDLPIHGTEWGPKISAEAWINIGADAFASIDASYTTAFDTYASHARLGYRILPTVSAGVEAAINGNEKNQDYRGGLFLRYQWFSGEIAVAGGFLSSDLGNISDRSLYGTVNWATHY